MAAMRRPAPRGTRQRPDRAADRRRAHDRPGRAPARDPGRRLAGRARPRRSPPTPTASASGTSSAMSSARPTPAFLEALRGPYLRGVAHGSRASGPRPNGDALYRTAIRAWTTLEMDPPRDPPDRPRRDRVDRGRAPGHRAARGLRRRHGRLPGRITEADPANTPQTKDEMLARATEDIDRAMALAPRYFGALPRAGLRSGRSRSSRRRTRRSPTTTRPPRTARGRGSTTPTATTCRRASTPSSPRRPTTRPCPGTTSRSRSRWRTRTSTRSGGSARGWSAAPSSRAGACTASAWPTRWASSATRPSGSACSTRRPGGPPGSSSTPGMHALRWTRQQSIDYLLSAGLSLTDATIETDRYIAWPAQALTYKLGQRAIEQLRAPAHRARRLAVRPARVPRPGARPRLAPPGHARARAPGLGHGAGLSRRLGARSQADVLAWLTTHTLAVGVSWLDPMDVGHQMSRGRGTASCPLSVSNLIGGFPTSDRRLVRA